MYGYGVDPIAVFLEWYDEARRTPGIIDADACALATATRDGRPSVRMVLLRGFSGGGARFFTNYESRKAHELDDNPRAALCFHWAPLERQVRFEGTVERLTTTESDVYFASRPAGSRLSAIVSPQSRPIASRDELEAKRAALAASGQPLVRPPFWGGYRLLPDAIELWRAGPHRLHERQLFTREPGATTEGWRVELLGP
jgi:pyridoxamine 5'-phosphate oxidase